MKTTEKILLAAFILVIVYSIFTSESLSVSSEEELSGYQKQVLCENLYWKNRPDEMIKQGCDLQATSDSIDETIRGY